MRTCNIFWLVLITLTLFQLPTLAEAQLNKDVLHIQTAKKSIALTVELAVTPEQIKKGLMFRRSLNKNSGMLFLFKEEIYADFWMKNTYIPLDILFIDKQGVIITMVENAEPLSTRLIPSGGKIKGVLELAGGSAAKLHIATGDKVIYRHFHE